MQTTTIDHCMIRPSLKYGDSLRSTIRVVKPSTRTPGLVNFSDGLDFKKAKELNEQCQQLVFKCLFGIGTRVTNDFKKKSSGYKEQSKALNIVIKLGSIDGKECVGIGGEITKNTGVRIRIMMLWRRLIKEMYQILGQSIHQQFWLAKGVPAQSKLDDETW
ncbi:nicotinate phosphoribosyltransferase family-domain-containing protein [Suillus lakei]|nr:nicotinate phosphoribosyltransferase family-domain-containing protein [Suillus lakei]